MATFFHSEADPGFFLGAGALVSCFTSTPINHIVFFFVLFCRIPVVLENRRSCRRGGGGEGAHPLHPPPLSFLYSGTKRLDASGKLYFAKLTIQFCFQLDLSLGLKAEDAIEHVT